ncbi:PadR family transcriptional regulator [Tomitella gaofuii]|uniref:PadR family transcriptional regulator n=1 Tax=Tomitella gaofuii TaxID=2760083 RepID=UPI001F228BAB|nr:PadR family transcriptional regulator [Tomitella gaofuii]
MPTTDDAPDPSDEDGLPSMPATAWAVLGTLSFGEGLSGYDIKTWADWSLNYFYWSPSFSQVYSELKRLEKHGFVESDNGDGGARNRRVYTITPAGLAALRRWARESEVDRPVLKHATMLHLWMGHLSDPVRLKEMVRAHIEQMTALRDGAAERAQNARREPSWAYTQIVMEWSRRHYDSEILLAEELLEQIDAAGARFDSAAKQEGTGLPIPVEPGHWKSRA